MSDLPPGYAPPPPPPPGTPPPAYQPPPGYQPLPTYQPVLEPSASYPAAWARGAASRGAVAAGGGFAVLNQFGGYAAWSIGLGLVAIIVPLTTDFYFPVLPIAGALNGFRAFSRGRLIGGMVGIGLNIIAGVISLIASGLLRPGQ